MENNASDSLIVIPTDNADVEAECKVTSSEALLMCMFEMERWSTLNKAYRVIAWTLRFIKRVRKAVISSSRDLCDEELLAAKEAFVKILQLQYFAKEISHLRDRKSISRDSKLTKLVIFIDDDGVLRVRGWIQLSELAYESKHPVILPRCDCHGSWLLVKFVHMFQMHAGFEAMITYVRKNYEVFGLHLMAQSTKKNCVFCKKCDVRACNEPPVPLLRL